MREKEKVLFIGVVIASVMLLLLVLVGSSGILKDLTRSFNNSDEFNGKDAKLENVSITSSHGFFKVSGKIMFRNDNSYAQIGADVNLKDGTKISESIVKNWNDVKKGEWYTFDGMLMSTSGHDYSLSDIQSIDFKFNDQVIYTWEGNFDQEKADDVVNKKENKKKQEKKEKEMGEDEYNSRSANAMSLAEQRNPGLYAGSVYKSGGYWVVSMYSMDTGDFVKRVNIRVLPK
jgi:hypothetical protein